MWSQFQVDRQRLLLFLTRWWSNSHGTALGLKLINLMEIFKHICYVTPNFYFKHSAHISATVLTSSGVHNSFWTKIKHLFGNIRSISFFLNCGHYFFFFGHTLQYFLICFSVNPKHFEYSSIALKFYYLKYSHGVLCNVFLP